MIRRIVQALARPLWRVLPLLPIVALAGIAVCAASHPRALCGSILVDLHLPSERAIAPDRVLKPDPLSRIVQIFRYQPTGTELHAGIPYWIFRALPRLFPEAFAGQPEGREWEVFGFFGDSDPAIARGAGLPRGLVVADSELQLPGMRVGVGLKRVALNCAACHQGEYLDASGQRILIDGAPNHVADAQAYKRFIRNALADSRFNPDNVLGAIDAELVGTGAARLTAWERLVYSILVDQIGGPGKRAAWMDRRPDCGPGRIDAFSAFKYEVLGVPDDQRNATVDLPSVWNQRASMRSWHHWDGNTADSRARNYGSIIGVGGSALSVRGANVDAVAAWLDDELRPPAFPFRRPSPAQGPSSSGQIGQDDGRLRRGRDLYVDRCAECHGVYDPASRQVDPTLAPKYMTIVDVGTDSLRWQAFDSAAAALINRWGYQRGVWSVDAFRPASQGYLAGPLDGVWARAPYLHNGSVPTLRHLVTRGSRPERFWRGSRHYDAADMGWDARSEAEAGTGRRLFLYDTSLPGNSNQGHDVWIDDPADVDALLDYLATL